MIKSCRIVLSIIICLFIGDMFIRIPSVNEYSSKLIGNENISVIINSITVYAESYEANNTSYIAETQKEETDDDLYIGLYSENEIYELAKIIMAEAEGESQECKEYIGQVVLNRVESNKFPDTIHDVIFQRNQFTPTFDGRWEEVEPNQDCYDAVYSIINASEPITEALYFEACNGESWHSRNLIKIKEIDNTRFYIE